MQAHHNHNQPHEQQQNIQIQDPAQNIKNFASLMNFSYYPPIIPRLNSKTIVFIKICAPIETTIRFVFV